MGNCSFDKGDVEKAKELYNVALENDASCVEALYNLGLCNKKLGFYEDALECFFKLQSIVRNHAQVNNTYLELPFLRCCGRHQKFMD